MLPTNSILNERFRKEFLLDLPGRFHVLGQLILHLEKQANPREGLIELFLIIHSIRGSSSTFGLQILASICNPLEELIQHTSETESDIHDFIAVALSYLDLMRQATDIILGEGENFEQVEKLLADLHQHLFRQQFSIAIAVNSRMLREICRKITKEFEARVIEFEDSLNALQRILTEPFHIVIVSSELYPLMGEALIAAINLSPRRTHGATTILLSANEGKAGRVNRTLDPDFVVLRDQNFIPRLHGVIDGIHKQSLDGASQRK